MDGFYLSANYKLRTDFLKSASTFHDITGFCEIIQ